MSPNDKKRSDIKVDIEIDIENIDERSTDILNEMSAAERATELARGQASEAVNALRRGELVQDSSIDQNASRDDRMIALLCYLFPLIMSVIVLISESSKTRPFQRYHAVQGLGLAVALGVLGTGIGIFASIIMVIPVIGWLIGIMLFCLSPIGVAMGALAHIYYGYQAYQGKRFAIPGIASFLRSQGWL